MAVKHRNVQIGMRDFSRWILHLFQQPVFLFVTFLAQVSIVIGAICFRHFESGVNPKVDSFFHSYYWAVSMATTVGSTDILPQTMAGKSVAIALMLTGTFFLWTYAALFAASVVMPSVKQFGIDVKKLEADVHDMDKDVVLDRKMMEKLLHEMEEMNRLRK